MAQPTVSAKTNQENTMKLTNSEWHVMSEAVALAEATAATIPNLACAEKTVEARALLMSATITDGYRAESNSLLARMLPAGAEGFEV